MAIKERDKISPSPEQRARYIWYAVQRLTPKPTLWDIICFCSETLSAASLEHEWLKYPAKMVSKSLYIAHYLTDTPIDSCLVAKSVEPTTPSTSVQG